MTREMHNWIAMLLGILTVIALKYDKYFIKAEDEITRYIFFLQVSIPILMFGLWFFAIVTH